jgi:predicted phosphatase
MGDIPFDIAFDWDGTLTDGAIVETGHDNAGVTIDLAPLRWAMRKGYTVAIMTCNDPWYVWQKLFDADISAYADIDMANKCPPQWLGTTIMITQRKVYARVYVDDHGLRWAFGDAIADIERELQ